MVEGEREPMGEAYEEQRRDSNVGRGILSSLLV